jgi:hypothetical protein
MIWLLPRSFSTHFLDHVFSLSQSSCVSPVTLPDRRGRGRGSSQIVRQQENLVLHNPLLLELFSTRCCKSLGNYSRMFLLKLKVKYGDRSPKFIWAPVYSCIHWLRPRNSPLPPHLGSYARALLVS